MKTTKTRKYLSLLMAICMLMSCLMQISAFAIPIQESEMIPEGGEEELMPMGANSCQTLYYRANNWTVRDSDVEFLSNGYISTSKGISVATSPEAIRLANISSIFSVTCLPEGLVFTEPNSAGHCEIVPEYPMHIETYKGKISEIVCNRIV